MKHTVFLILSIIYFGNIQALNFQNNLYEDSIIHKKPFKSFYNYITSNGLERSVSNIGKLKYIKTTVFGRMRAANKEIISFKNIDGEEKKIENNCDYIISFSKKAVAITIPNPFGNLARVPYVVKRLKFMHKINGQNNSKVKFFIDNDGYTWMYMKDEKGELIGITNGEKSDYIIYLELIKIKNL